jgi:hypothetical protein
MSKKTKSKTSPEGGRKGCLCDDGTYKAECCNGDLLNQGVGTLVSQGVSEVTNANQARVIVNTRG